MSTQKIRKPGRPRDEATRARILRSAVEILIGEGYQRATMNEIALQSGAGKQTLYRWWKNRAELLMEALLYYAEEKIDTQNTGGNKSALKQFLVKSFNSVNNETGVILKSLAAESIADRDFSLAFFNTFIAKRQDVLAEIIRENMPAHGAGRETVNTLVDMVFGAMWYRLIFGHRPLDTRLAASLSDIVQDFCSRAQPADTSRPE